MTLKYQCAVVFVKDLAAARRFYEELLEMQVEADFGANVGYVGGLAIWEVGSAYQMIHGRTAEDVPALGRDNLELFFETDDLDAAWERLHAAGVTVIKPVREQPWGQRVLHIADPDGHVVEIAEPMAAVVRRMVGAGLTDEAISVRTMLPVAAVQQWRAEGDAS
ncbi:MAG: VOC family protein [Anaerolineae bacterium]|nr:VOC family protein [Anaerolineae bacterium]